MVTKYKHGIASYPKGWRGYVVSENKICIQFDDVQCKTRIHNRECEDLRKTTKGSWHMPIDSHGTDVSFVSMGIPLDLYKTIFDKLLNAFEEHVERFGEGYGVRGMLLNLADKIDETFGGGK